MRHTAPVEKLLRRQVLKWDLHLIYRRVNGDSPVLSPVFPGFFERQFRKVRGYREIPALLTALANTVSKKVVAEEVKVA